MEINGFGRQDLLYSNMAQTPKTLMRDVLPNEREVEVKVDISKEGMEALREKVQPSTINMEEWLREREILPKLQMDPVGSHYFEMAKYEGELLEQVKLEKGEYTVDDIIDIQSKAYQKSYQELQKAYENGERDIYICNGMIDGKMQYHQVTQEEDFAYLKQAYERLSEKVALYASIQKYRIEK